jgi:glycosyltransferase involved in cell wall biosynthesis
MVGWKSRLPLNLCRRLSANVALAIANSHAGEAHHRDIGFRCSRWEVIPNGVDTQLFRPDSGMRAFARRQWNIGDDELAIGIVARLSEIKDHPTFLRAAAMLRDVKPAVRFVVVGGGSDAYRAQLHELSATLGITDRIHWAGDVRNVTEAYNGLDVVVLSSSSGEGSPNSVLEAMACERRCVATDVGDVRRIVGDYGRIVAPGDPEALGSALRDVVQAGLYGECAEARERVEKEFSLARMVERTESALDSVVSNPTAQDESG